MTLYCETCGDAIGELSLFTDENGKADGSEDYDEWAGRCPECERTLCEDCGGFDYRGLCRDCQEAAELEKEAG